MSEAALPVKRITDFPLEESATLIRRPAFWGAFILAMAVIAAAPVAYSAATHVEVEVPPWALIGFLIVLFIGCTRVIDLVDEARKARAAKSDGGSAGGGGSRRKR